MSEDIMGKVMNPGDFVQYQDGTIVSSTIIHKTTGNITLFAFDAGQEVSDHAAPFDALVYILDGEAQVKNDGQVHVVPAGQGIILPEGKIHSLQAEKRFKMMLVMIRS